MTWWLSRLLFFCSTTYARVNLDRRWRPTSSTDTTNHVHTGRNCFATRTFLFLFVVICDCCCDCLSTSLSPPPSPSSTPFSALFIFLFTFPLKNFFISLFALKVLATIPYFQIAEGWQRSEVDDDTGWLLKPVMVTWPWRRRGYACADWLTMNE